VYVCVNAYTCVYVCILYYYACTVALLACATSDASLCCGRRRSRRRRSAAVGRRTCARSAGCGSRGRPAPSEAAGPRHGWREREARSESVRHARWRAGALRCRRDPDMHGICFHGYCTARLALILA
jgi:hypothetical protein